MPPKQESPLSHLTEKPNPSSTSLPTNNADSSLLETHSRHFRSVDCASHPRSFSVQQPAWKISSVYPKDLIDTSLSNQGVKRSAAN